MDLDSPFDIRTNDRDSNIDHGSNLSEEVNSAFLDAIRVHPLSQALQLSETTERREYTRVKHIESIQNFILERTGITLTNQDVQERVADAFISEKSDLYYDTSNEHGCSSEKLRRGLSSAHNSPSQSLEPIDTNNITFSRSADVDHPSLLNVVHTNISSSMSRRREASNRPTLKLHVEMPPQSFNGNLSRSLFSPTISKQRSATPGSTSITPSWFRIQMMGSKLSENSTPITPADKRIMTPIAPPEIPRTINIRRNAISHRWAPTPTEVVPPSLSYMTFDASPTMGITSGSQISSPTQMLHPFSEDFSIYKSRVSVSNGILDDSPRCESSGALMSPLILSN